MTVLVCGATGFVGSAITRHLLDAGASVRALSRAPARAAGMFASFEAGRRALVEGRLTFAEGDVTQPPTLLAAVRGVEAVIQATQFENAPVEDPSRGLTYQKLDRDGTINLLQAASPSGAGGPRFLYMSGITVSSDAPEPWNKAKWQAEQAIKASGLHWTIVRSCWAYGPGDKALNRLLGYSDLLPFVPIFGPGREPLTPVFVEDVGRLFALLLADPARSRDTIFNVGGPDILTLNEFLRAALAAKDRLRPILHVPKPLGKVMAQLLQHLPGRPLTPDAVDFVSQGGTVTPADRQLLAERFPALAPTPLSEGLASYLRPSPNLSR